MKSLSILIENIIFFLVVFGFAGESGNYEGISIDRNIPKEKKGPRIALITFISEPRYAHRSEEYHPYPDMVKFGTRSKKLYCQKHGYDFIIGSKKMDECQGIPAPNKDKLAILWMKVPMLAKFLNDYDWVVWSDADSIILNPEITLESLIDPQYDIIFGTHHQNPNDPEGFGDIGSGHVFVKNCPWSMEFLKGWWLGSEEKIEGSWDLEYLNDWLERKPEFTPHVGYLPVKKSDLAPTEFQLGDFLVHFYACHGKELCEAFQEYEKKYGYIINNLEKEVVKSQLSNNEYTDHTKIFDEIFTHSQAKGILEFGLGYSTKFFLLNTQPVISVEFVTNALNTDWLNKLLIGYSNEKNWFPIAFLSGCTEKTYHLDSHPNLKTFQATPKVYDAMSLASYLCDRKLMPSDISYLREMEQFISREIFQKDIDIGFVDSGLILRGELVQLLFNKVPIILAHDFPKDISKVDPATDVYGYTTINAPSNYVEIYFGKTICRQGLKVWINKKDLRFEKLILRLTELAQN